MIIAGSTVYHPVQVPGALFYTSDCHAVQGNGEVSLTAIETYQTPTFQVIPPKEANLEDQTIPVMKNPWCDTEEAYIVTGTDVSNLLAKKLVPFSLPPQGTLGSP